MQQYGLIGKPLGHSFSQRFFTEKFQREGLDAAYSNYELQMIEELPALLREHPDLCGLNVTIPYKEAVIPYLNEVSAEAEKIGAVNTVRVSLRNGTTYLEGFNTDLIGFRKSLEPLLKPHHTAALVLGTGGASKAVCAALQQLGIAVQRVSRNSAANTITYDELTPEVMALHTLIINCSPVGMFPHFDTFPQIPYHCLTSQHLLYDLVYNPEETLFLSMGRRYGAQMKGGLEMLHIQAEAAWEIWNRNRNMNYEL